MMAIDRGSKRCTITALSEPGDPSGLDPSTAASDRYRIRLRGGVSAAFVATVSWTVDDPLAHELFRSASLTSFSQLAGIDTRRGPNYCVAPGKWTFWLVGQLPRARPGADGPLTFVAATTGHRGRPRRTVERPPRRASRRRRGLFCGRPEQSALAPTPAAEELPAADVRKNAFAASLPIFSHLVRALWASVG